MDLNPPKGDWILRGNPAKTAGIEADLKAVEPIFAIAPPIAGKADFAAWVTLLKAELIELWPFGVTPPIAAVAPNCAALGFAPDDAAGAEALTEVFAPWLIGAFDFGAKLLGLETDLD